MIHESAADVDQRQSADAVTMADDKPAKLANDVVAGVTLGVQGGEELPGAGPLDFGWACVPAWVIVMTEPAAVSEPVLANGDALAATAYSIVFEVEPPGEYSVSQLSDELVDHVHPSAVLTVSVEDSAEAPNERVLAETVNEQFEAA